MGFAEEKEKAERRKVSRNRCRSAVEARRKKHHNKVRAGKKKARARGGKIDVQRISNELMNVAKD